LLVGKIKTQYCELLNILEDSDVSSASNVKELIVRDKTEFDTRCKDSNIWPLQPPCLTQEAKAIVIQFAM